MLPFDNGIHRYKSNTLYAVNNGYGSLNNTSYVLRVSVPKIIPVNNASGFKVDYWLITFPVPKIISVNNGFSFEINTG